MNMYSASPISTNETNPGWAGRFLCPAIGKKQTIMYLIEAWTMAQITDEQAKASRSGIDDIIYMDATRQSQQVVSMLH
jgi:hypothetical protein